MGSEVLEAGALEDVTVEKVVGVGEDDASVLGAAEVGDASVVDASVVVASVVVASVVEASVVDAEVVKDADELIEQAWRLAFAFAFELVKCTSVGLSLRHNRYTAWQVLSVVPSGSYSKTSLPTAWLATLSFGLGSRKHVCNWEGKTRLTTHSM